MSFVDPPPAPDTDNPRITPGLVCSHHHLYSALARGMPAPPKDPASFLEILEQVWWRLDTVLDAELIEWSAKLGALEALERGCTAIIDHHESPRAIDGSLDIIAEACEQVGVRVSCAYGVTDRHGRAGAQAGLAENERFLRAGGTGMVGVHASFTCEDDTLQAAAALADDLGVGVHIHVAEGIDDFDAAERLVGLTNDKWLLVHGVHLATNHSLRGTIVHNPRSNMNNGVGYAKPTRFTKNRIALGTDGIGADMLDEFRLAYFRLREHDMTETPQTAWGWLETGWQLFPAALEDEVMWSYEPMDPWRLAFSPGVSPWQVKVGGAVVFANGQPTRVDGRRIRARAAEAAEKLFRRL